MADTQQFIFFMRELEGNTSALTDNSNEFRLKQVGVNIIEMEDVLFHLDSAVMMPDNPAGKSSTQGLNDDRPGSAGEIAHKEQIAVSGIQALALVYKQFEFDPEKRLVVAGHTDTSGEPRHNFELSEARAQNVLFLLTVDRDAWAENSAKRHNVEDFQQIMKFFDERKPFDCDPGKLDNIYGKKTDTATENFLRGTLTDPPESDQIDEILKKIRATHKWPVEAWRAVFDLYMEVLADTLQVTPSDMPALASTLTFADDKNKILACGESFPIDEKLKSNYRSQTNRRVELLLFDKDDVPVLDCPPKVNGQFPNKVHTSEECPIYDKINIIPLYIDPKDLFATVYHFRLVYFDRIKETLVDVPPGLRLQAFSDGNESIPTVTVVRNGIYFVKVQFPKRAKELEFKNLRFRFTTSDLFVVTESKSAAPRLQNVPQADFDKLDPAEKKKFYRLPAAWNSNGFMARFKGPSGGVTTDDVMEGRDTKEIFKFLFTGFFADRKPKFKPFGSDITTPQTPIILCLDDIRLTNADLLSAGAGKLQGAFLDDHLRVLDPDTSNHRSFYSNGIIDPDCIPFSKKMIPVRAIVYAHQVFNIYDDRLSSADATGPFDGMRAASHGRPPHVLLQENFNQKMPVEETGNSDLYLMRDWDTVNGESIFFLLMHLRWQFIGGTDPDKKKDPPFTVTPEFVETTVNNIMGFWNNRTKAGVDELTSLTSEDAPGKKKRIFIRYYLEPVTADVHTKITVLPAGSRGRSFMGVTDGELRADDNHPHGEENRFTAAHEFGHATSISDEYCENAKNASFRENGFGSFTPGSPYSFDETGDMVNNIEGRARYYWHLAEWAALQEGIRNTYTVERGKYKYRITPFGQTPKARVRTFHHFPIFERQNISRGTPRAKYDVVINQIGLDEYGKGDRPGALVPGHEVDGIFLVLLKLKVNFLETNDFFDIQNTLGAIDRRIKLTFNHRDADHQGKFFFRGTSTGPIPVSLKSCALFFFPRYLVPNFPGPKDSMAEKYARACEVFVEGADKKFDHSKSSQAYTKLVTSLEGERHFDVHIRSAGTFERHKAVWDGPAGRLLTIITGTFTGADELVSGELPRMIGIDKNADDLVANDLLHLSDGLLSDASIGHY